MLFEPPFMVPPALGVRVLDEKDSEADLQATLFDLAERGVLHLRGGDESWYVELVQPPEGEQLHPLESGLLNSLGLHQIGDTFVVASTESWVVRSPRPARPCVHRSPAARRST